MSDPDSAAVTLDTRAVISALARAAIVTDPDGRILLWNAAAERLYGWSEREALGRSVLDLLAPAADVATNREHLNSVAAGTARESERPVMCRDGSTVHVRTSTQPVLDADGNVRAIVGLSEDVSELRRTELNSRNLGEHFRIALEAGGLGTWRWDMASGATVWDKRLEALFGLAPGGFDGTYDAYLALLHPDDRDAVADAVEAAVTARSTYRVEHRVIWPDGSVHWIAGAGGVTFDERDEVSGTVGCAMDVTDRRNRELERQQQAAEVLEVAERESLQRERLEFLTVVNDALNESQTVREIMINVTERIVPRLGDWCAIHVLPSRDAVIPDIEIAHVDPEMVAYGRQLIDRFPYDPNAPTGVARVIRTGETLFYPVIDEAAVAELETSLEEQRIITELALQSVIVVPLVKRERVLGAIQFVMSASSRTYTEDDVTLARSIAGRIASSLENRRLSEQQRRIAETLQRSLLPSSLPEVPGIEIAVRYWPAGEAAEVGGDFYDMFATESPDQWALVIGDVCGTGPAAAALTGLARHSIRDSAWHGDSPVQVLDSLNRAVLRSGANSFLTAVYATLGTSGSQIELTVACGGHPSPIHATAGRTTGIGQPGTLLGVLDRGRFEACTTRLEPGDVVVFYTDGATDLPPPHLMDEDQFAELVARVVAPGRDAQAVADHLHKELDSIVPFDDRDDDIALLVIRVADAGG